MGNVRDKFTKMTYTKCKSTCISEPKINDLGLSDQHMPCVLTEPTRSCIILFKREENNNADTPTF